MERAGRLIGKLKIPRGAMSPEELARAAWPVAVGKKIAQHTNVVGLVRDCLVVEVEDAVWQRHLNSLRRQIIGNLIELLKPGVVVSDLDLRPMVPRRGPQRAERPSVSVSTDDADQIADPVLRRVYKIARKKASA